MFFLSKEWNRKKKWFIFAYICIWHLLISPTDLKPESIYWKVSGVKRWNADLPGLCLRRPVQGFPPSWIRWWRSDLTGWWRRCWHAAWRWGRVEPTPGRCPAPPPSGPACTGHIHFCLGHGMSWNCAAKWERNVKQEVEQLGITSATIIEKLWLKYGCQSDMLREEWQVKNNEAFINI